MKKIYRPLWSYDVQKTEEWLADMAGQGLLFDRLNRWTRCFYFQERKPAKRVYQIAYDKISSSVLPKTLRDEGWEKAATAGKWKFNVNDHPSSEIKTSPIREGVIKHNRMITYLFFPVVFYFIFILLNFTTAMTASWIQDGGSNIVESPMWIMTYLFFAFALGSTVFGIYSIAKITRTNKEMEGTANVDPHQRDKLSEKELKREGRWVTKLKFSWMYSPDKMEHWLELMEQRGLNLYRVSKSGTIFQFAKGEPRQVAYRIDYQRGPTQSYFAIHREAGWKEEFSSFSTMEKWTIWSKVYDEGEARPQLYSDQSSRLKHAKRIAITYTAMFLPFVAFYVYFILMNITRAENMSEWLSRNTTALFILAVLIFGTFIFRTWAYYRRLKKQTTAWGN